MPDKIIRFPGTAGKPSADKAPADKPAPGGKTSKAKPPGEAVLDAANLSEDQKKAVQLALSGLPFVMVGIKPTTTGADFFTALHGEDGDLRNALPHLGSVIERAFSRKGL